MKNILLQIYVLFALMLGFSGGRILLNDHRSWVIALFTISVAYAIWFVYEKIKELKNE